MKERSDKRKKWRTESTKKGGVERNQNYRQKGDMTEL